ncbi:PEP-CTERM sorting domain-containing protein [Glaciecola sp. MF2-115]|uniref:PEP-CTERM sorting domain-containing protein n=1 Tax=Glaciecola sp. MF2-115 TaxID=3384827 RepID=UPI00399F69EA
MNKKFIKSLVLSFSLAVSGFASAGMILFVDDTNGKGTSSTWLNSLDNLGYSYDFEVIGVNGNPLSVLDNYDAVIWSIGDRAYQNLTSQNVSTLSSYLNAGGNLLYAGGHSVYQEAFASSFISTYLGLTNYHSNMPYFNNNSVSTGTGHSITNSNIFDLQVMPGPTTHGGTMMSAFNVSTAESMMTSPAGGPFIAAVNETEIYSAMTWGFDLNMLAQQAEREQLLGDSLAYMITPVPEPSTVAVFALALFGLAFRKFKK